MRSSVDCGSRWCVLRTSGPRTLALARSLAGAGIEAWTPMHVLSRRRPRSKLVVDRDAPIMPTFVFVRAAYLADVMRVLSLPVNPHPPFSLFQWAGRVPIIHDRDVESLRLFEDQERERARRALLKTQRHVFPVGDRVKVVEGTFTGMSGVVLKGDGKEAWVNFGGSMRVRVATWLLATDALQAGTAREGTAAQAASDELIGQA